MHCERNKLPPSGWFRGGRYEEEMGRKKNFRRTIFSQMFSQIRCSCLFFLMFVYVLIILHVKRRETFPKRNNGRDDTRDEEKSLLPSDNEGEEDVEGPPKVNL